MKYWDEMRSKYGFDDGAAEPSEARLLRKVYVTAVNNIAERRGSQVRVVCYDRPGMHNSCMIVNVPLAAYLALTESQRAGALPAGCDLDCLPDEALSEAIQEAEGLSLSQYVIVPEPVVDPVLEILLDRLKSEAVDD